MLGASAIPWRGGGRARPLVGGSNWTNAPASGFASASVSMVAKPRSFLLATCVNMTNNGGVSTGLGVTVVDTLGLSWTLVGSDVVGGKMYAAYTGSLSGPVTVTVECDNTSAGLVTKMTIQVDQVSGSSIRQQASSYSSGPSLAFTNPVLTTSTVYVGCYGSGGANPGAGGVGSASPTGSAIAGAQQLGAGVTGAGSAPITIDWTAFYWRNKTASAYPFSFAGSPSPVFGGAFAVEIAA